MLEAISPETERDDWIEEFLDPEIEWHDTPTYPSAGVYVGRGLRSPCCRIRRCLASLGHRDRGHQSRWRPGHRPHPLPGRWKAKRRTDNGWTGPANRRCLRASRRTDPPRGAVC